MPPVVQIPVSSKIQQEKTRKLTDRRPELFCRVKYCNTLPDIPFDPKFVAYPFDTNRFVQYKQTSLEKNYKHDLLTEQDLGVSIDLINPETYEIGDHPHLRLAEEDEKLLEDEALAPQDTKRSRCHNRAVTWLKKTEYISTEFNRYGASSDKTETKVGFGVKKRMKDENLYLDKESQILAINKTFEAAKKPITSHPGKPGVKAVDILPVFPDFELWKYPFAQVMFDADPAPLEKDKEMSQAMIRGIMDESGEQYVAYFLPTEDTMNKRTIDDLEGHPYVDGQEYEYIQTREYNWNVKNKATKGYSENYFFVWRDDSVCYNELETRVKLSKRRVKSSVAPNSRLLIKHRNENEQEYNTQCIRMTQLEPLQEEEELEPEIAEDKDKDNEDVDFNKENNKENVNDDKEAAQSDAEESDKSDESDSESEPEERTPKRKKLSSESEKSSSSSESSSESDSEKNSSSSSSEESDEEDATKKRRKQQTADIFGSDSD